MLIKLLKYELRSTLKIFAGLWIAVLALAAVNRFTLNSFQVEINGFVDFLIHILPFIVFVCVMVGMAVAALVLLIRRFYGGLLGSEGYLMFTLPVKAWQLITAKGIAAVIIMLISSIVGILSVLLLLKWSIIEPMVSGFFRFRFWSDTVTLTAVEAVILAIEAVIIIIVVTAKGMYKIYAAAALGHLFRKGRVGMAFVMYIAISVLGVILAGAMGEGAELFEDIASALFKDVSLFGGLNLCALIVFVVSAVPLAVFHTVTERILATRLNLE